MLKSRGLSTRIFLARRLRLLAVAGNGAVGAGRAGVTSSKRSRFHRLASSTSRAVIFADFERLAFAVIASRLKNVPASSGIIERGKTCSSAMPSPACGPWVIVGDPPCLSSSSPASVKHQNSSSFARLQIIACLSALAAAVPS